MAKDRAAPFSRKHRRYWITVTGGMIFIGTINLVVGVCSYTPAPPPPQPIIPVLPHADAAPPDAPGTISSGELPPVVIRAFAARYPQTISPGARVEGDSFVILLPPGRPHHSATFRRDGTFVSEQ